MLQCSWLHRVQQYIKICTSTELGVCVFFCRFSVEQDDPDLQACCMQTAIACRNRRASNYIHHYVFRCTGKAKGLLGSLFSLTYAFHVSVWLVWCTGYICDWYNQVYSGKSLQHLLSSSLGTLKVTSFKSVLEERGKLWLILLVWQIVFQLFFSSSSSSLQSVLLSCQLTGQLSSFCFAFLCAVYNRNDNIAGICIIARQRILWRDNSECVETTHHLDLMFW